MKVGSELGFARVRFCPMSVHGTKRTCHCCRRMSAFGGKADIPLRPRTALGDKRACRAIKGLGERHGTACARPCKKQGLPRGPWISPMPARSGHGQEVVDWRMCLPVSQCPLRRTCTRKPRKKTGDEYDAIITCDGSLRRHGSHARPRARGGSAVHDRRQ
jgi:hypothetical protein